MKDALDASREGSSKSLPSAVQHRGHRYCGMWNDRQVSFKDSWSRHAFGREEAACLLAGEELEIDFTTSNGTLGHTKGALGYSEYEGRHYFGFIPCYSKDYKGPLQKPSAAAATQSVPPSRLPAADGAPQQRRAAGDRSSYEGGDPAGRR